jgi:hypothetical protein
MSLPSQPDNFYSGYTFQIDADIRRDARISLRILFKFIFAPVTAEIIHLVSVHTGKFCIFLINYHKTDGICCHGWLPLYCYQYRHIPLSVMPFLYSNEIVQYTGENPPPYTVLGEFDYSNKKNCELGAWALEIRGPDREYTKNWGMNDFDTCRMTQKSVQHDAPPGSIVRSQAVFEYF